MRGMTTVTTDLGALRFQWLEVALDDQRSAIFGHIKQRTVVLNRLSRWTWSIEYIFHFEGSENETRRGRGTYLPIVYIYMTLINSLSSAHLST